MVDRAYNGLEGLQKVKESFLDGKHVYGLIITDISMPVMDGYEATSEIREFYRQNQVMQPMIVACTGHVEEQFIMKAWMHEIDEILPKPVKSEILKEIIKEVVNLSDS